MPSSTVESRLSTLTFTDPQHEPGWNHATLPAPGGRPLPSADPVTTHVTDLIGSGYDGTTVLDVLTMTTGVEWVEDHRDPESLLRAVRPEVAPLTRFSYLAVDGAGVALAGGALAATARDWAKVALLGRNWVAAAARPAYPERQTERTPA